MDHHNRTALVLGGGGAVGNAWLVGVLAGLHEAGIAVTAPDLVIGTSAGATAAAQIAAADPSRLLARILDAEPPTAARPAGAPRPESAVMDRTARVIAESYDLADMRRRLGRSALELDAGLDGTEQQRWRDTVAARLPHQHWPQQLVRLTAVDAHTGEPVAFDRDSGIELVDAVAASCASAFAYRIGERRYIDGGYRTNADNADLAAGYDDVLVLSPFGGRARTPFEWGGHLATQVEQLRSAGSEVGTIFPDAAALEAFGDSMTDLSRRPAAAGAGHRQGKEAAARRAPR